MKPADLLPDQVQIRRPVPRKLLHVRGLIAAVTNRRHVVRQRVQPHVNHMLLLIPGNRDAPLETGAGDAQIFQPRTHERQDLIAPGLRLDQQFIRFDQSQQLVLVCRQPEVVVRLAHRLRDIPTVGADYARRPIHIRLIRHAVLTRIGIEVDGSIGLKLREKPLNAPLMARLRRPDIVVIRQTHPVPQAAKLARNLICKLLWRNPGRSGRALNLLPMLVRSR